MQLARLLAVALVAALVVAACGQAVPPPSASPVAVATPIATPSPTPAPVPTATPDPTPAPTLALHGIEIFPGGSGSWELAATETNADGVSRTVVLRAITDTIEIYAECVGTGVLAVTVYASPPAGESPTQPAPTPFSLTTFDLTCPDDQSVSFGGSAPAGWFVSPDATPSDLTIQYQILVATGLR